MTGWLRELLNRTRDPAPPPLRWVRVRHTGQPGCGSFQYTDPDRTMRVLTAGETATVDEPTYLTRHRVLAKLDSN